MSAPTRWEEARIKIPARAMLIVPISESLPDRFLFNDIVEIVLGKGRYVESEQDLWKVEPVYWKFFDHLEECKECASTPLPNPENPENRQAYFRFHLRALRCMGLRKALAYEEEPFVKRCIEVKKFTPEQISKRYGAPIEILQEFDYWWDSAEEFPEDFKEVNLTGAIEIEIHPIFITVAGRIWDERTRAYKLNEKVYITEEDFLKLL